MAGEFINPLQQFLDSKAQGFCILDGGLATECERFVKLDNKLWSAALLLSEQGKEIIEDAHLRYYRAGADVGISASYQASIKGIMDVAHCDEEEALDVIKSSARILNSARAKAWSEIQRSGNRENRLRPLVCASIGCFGAALADGSEYKPEYKDRTSVADLIEWHRPRMECLASLLSEGVVDCFACETIPCIIEVEALLRLIASISTSSLRIPFWIAVTMRDGEHLRSGETFRLCLETILKLASELTISNQIIAIGVNCTNPVYVEAALGIIKEVFQSGSGKNVNYETIVYPNSGETWISDSHRWLENSKTPDESFAEYANNWHHLGARIIGGCCRTSPDTIKKIRENMSSQRVYDIS